MIKYSAAVRCNRLDQITSAAGSGAMLDICTVNSSVLVSFALNNPIAVPAGGEGFMPLSGFPKATQATGTGTAASARIRTSGGVVVLSGLTVGTSGTCNVVLTRTNIDNGETVALASAIIRAPGATWGCNFSGMEWMGGLRTGGSTDPNVNITVPRAAEINYLAQCGFQKTRLPIVWEMLQPLLHDSPANATIRAGFNPDIAAVGDFYTHYRDWITGVLDDHAAAGITCIIDLHNYGRFLDFLYQGDGSVSTFVAAPTEYIQPYVSDASNLNLRVFAKAGGATLTIANFVDFWTRVATYWGSNWNGSGLPHPGLGGYDLMNEPHDLPAVGSIEAWTYPQDNTIWSDFAQAAVTAIRAIDATTPIYVCGNDYSVPATWVSANPGFPLTGANIVYEPHIYGDIPGSGAAFDWTLEASQGATLNTPKDRLQTVITWAHDRGLRLAVGECGMPLGDANWITQFYNMLDLALDNNVEVYTWRGGNHWPNHGYAINHTSEWYQNKPLEPLVGGVMKKKLGVEQAVLFSSGGGYGLSGGAATGVPVRIVARGNLVNPVVVHISSDQGGSLSSADITIPAGANSEGSFTFTPVTNKKTTLTFTVTTPSEVSPPSSHVIYSYIDPVTLAATNLADAGMTLIAKYNAALWLAQNGYTDYCNEAVPTANGGQVRAIADAGYGGSVDNPMEMLCWVNSETGNANTPPLLSLSGAKPYLDYSISGSSPLWCKKQAPQGADWPAPVSRVPFDMGDSHFAIVAAASTWNLESYNGVLVHIGSSESFRRTEISIEAGVPKAFFQGSETSGDDATITSDAALTENTPAVITLTNKSGAQTLRVGSVSKGTPTTHTWATGLAFNQIMLGGNFANYYWRDVPFARIYSAVVGRGEPTTSELGVMENYLGSFF